MRVSALILLSIITSTLTAAPPWAPVQRDAEGRARNGQVLLPAPPPPRLRIAIIPDRTSGRDWGLPYLERAIEDLRRTQPDAIFTIGDMVQGYTRRVAAWEEEFDVYEGIVRRLDRPLYPVAGNHDVVSGSRRIDDRTFVELYRERVGPLWYAVHFDLASVIVLFSDDGAERLGAEQLAWLAEALAEAAARERPIMLLLHRPLWQSDAARWREAVAPLLERCSVDLVVAGHFHSLHGERSAEGPSHYVLGVCGGMIDQHPLTGQLHHLTYVDFEAGAAPRLFHQPVGSVLADDFVLSNDRGRARLLADDLELLRFEGALAEPWPGGVDGTLALRVRNPIDLPVEFSFELVRAGIEMSVEGEAWRSRALIDAHNPFVIDEATPFHLEPLPPRRLEPGEEALVELRLRADAHDLPLVPPELRATCTFVDERGRKVPVWRRLAPPIARRLPIADEAAAAIAFPLLPWVRAPYDLLEPAPTLSVWRDGEGTLILDCRIADDEHPQDATPEQRSPARWRNPYHDALLLRLGSSPEALYFLEPFRFPGPPKVYRVAAGGELLPADLIEAAVDREEESGRYRVRLRIDPGLGPFDGMALQLGVADNDFTYHTQWQWLAPEGVDATLGAAINLPP